MFQRSFILKLIILLYAGSIHSQETNNENLIFYDNLVGIENTRLYNGARYYDKYIPAIGNHTFFNSPKYEQGSLVYDGEAFFNVNLKYDLTTDELVTKLDGSKSFINLQLTKFKVNSFKIGKHHFIKLKDSENDELVSGYVELAYSSDTYRLIIKHSKIASERIKLGRLTYKFFKKSTYFLYFNNSLHKIKSYKTLKKMFPEYKETIVEYSQLNKNLLKTNEDQFLVNLLSKIDSKKTHNKTK